MATVQLLNLTKKFKDVYAVRDVNLEIHDKEFMALLGPSGCGKTTTLNMIAGLETPSSGQILIDGRSVTHVPAAKRDIAMVFQTYALYPHMSVYRNMSFALRIRKLPKEQIDKQLREAAQILGISALLERYPRQLSGGQRQRVAVGRAIVRDPKVFPLDEPLSNLDAVLRVQMRTELKLIFNRLGATVAYVTHDQAEAMTMSDRVAVFFNGKVQQVDTPLAIYHAPANQFVAGFVGSPPMNFISATVSAEGRLCLAAGELERLPDADLRPYSGQTVTVGIRPEDLQIHAAGEDDKAGIYGQVQVVEQLGATTLAYLRLGDGLIAAQLSASNPVAVGQRYAVTFPAARLHIFKGSDGEAIRTPGKP